MKKNQPALIKDLKEKSGKPLENGFPLYLSLTKQKNYFCFDLYL